MPHTRKRHLESLLRHLSKLSPLVGLIGHRQVGKTTLLESVSTRYLSLDDEILQRSANEEPGAFVASLKSLGTAIDECQLSEKLFPALKERVRTDKRPGQFYLSGSVRFTSKRLIRESLTGRIMSLELLPLTLSELDETQMPDTLENIMAARRMPDLRLKSVTAKERHRRNRLIEQYLIQGGLPGACFIRNPKFRAQKIMDQLETILDRDLRQIHDTTLTLPELTRFIRQLALADTGTLQYQALRRATGITPITQKKLLYSLEATFILRHLPIEGDLSGTAIFFEDQAEASILSQGQIGREQEWAGLIYRNLREQVFYRLGENSSFFQYRTRGGVLVPFAIRSPQSTVGFVPVRGNPSRRHTAAAQSFLRKYADSKAVLVTDEGEPRVIDDRTLILPASHLLFAE